MSPAAERPGPPPEGDLQGEVRSLRQTDPLHLLQPVAGEPRSGHGRAQRSGGPPRPHHREAVFRPVWGYPRRDRGAGWEKYGVLRRHRFPRRSPRGGCPGKGEVRRHPPGRGAGLFPRDVPRCPFASSPGARRRHDRHGRRTGPLRPVLPERDGDRFPWPDPHASCLVSLHAADLRIRPPISGERSSSVGGPGNRADDGLPPVCRKDGLGPCCGNVPGSGSTRQSPGDGDPASHPGGEDSTRRDRDPVYIEEKGSRACRNLGRKENPSIVRTTQRNDEPRSGGEILTRPDCLIPERCGNSGELVHGEQCSEAVLRPSRANGQDRHHPQRQGVGL